MRKNHRRTGRLRGDGLKCSLGEVVNVSAGGIVLRGRLSDEDLVEVRFGDDVDTPIVVLRRVWTRSAGFRTQESGYAFVDAPSDLTQKLWGVTMPETQPRVI